MRDFFKQSLELLGPSRSRLPKFLLLFLLASVLDMASIGLIGPYVAMVLNPEMASDFFQDIGHFINLEFTPHNIIILSSVFLLCLFIVKTLLSIWINYLIVGFSMSQQSRIRGELMNVYQNMFYDKYLYRNSSDYVHNILTLTQHYAINVVLPGMRMASDGVVAIAILLLLAWINLQALILLATLLGSVLLLYDKFLKGKILTLGRLSNEAEGRIVRSVREGVEGLKEIRVLGCEKFFLDRVKRDSSKHQEYFTKAQAVTTAPRYLLELSMISFICLFVLFNLNTEEGDFESFLPTLSAFGLAAVRLMPSANILSHSFMQMRLRRDSVSKLYNDMYLIHHQPISLNVEKESVKFSGLALKNISYKYPESGQNTLDNVSLEIKPGETVGFIGPSGSGKTTLLDMLLGMLDPISGSIEFNGKNLTLNKEEWRRNVAYITQQPFLVDGTFKSNIALGVPEGDIDLHRVDNAVRLSQLNEVIENTSNGLNTPIGEGGARLSGGQRQRVILARALYYNRSVLVMDESTSALDTETEKEISKEVRRLKGDKTIIIVAHRMSTLSSCDKIYKVDKGIITELKNFKKELF